MVPSTLTYNQIHNGTYTCEEVLHSPRLAKISLLNETPAGKHYHHLLATDRLFPTTKAQAAAVIKRGCTFDLLGLGDCLKIATLLRKYNLTAKFKYARGGNIVRIANMDDVFTALKYEYSL